MIEELFRIFDEHFIGKMQMSVYNEENLYDSKSPERMYKDDYITMIITGVSDDKPLGYIRVVIRNWKTGQSFSKNISIPKFREKTPDEVIGVIGDEVWSNSGVASRTLLIDWYEKKKVDIRDKKLKNLGI